MSLQGSLLSITVSESASNHDTTYGRYGAAVVAMLCYAMVMVE